MLNIFQNSFKCIFGNIEFIDEELLLHPRIIILFLDVILKLRICQPESLGFYVFFNKLALLADVDAPLHEGLSVQVIGLVEVEV